MCTATYIKHRDQIIFTTNRDERAARPTKAPEIYTVNGLKLLFPRDELAGGTWIAVSEDGRIACMMNGAEGEGAWLGTNAKKSRGQVLLDSFQFDDADSFLELGDFEEANPFTMILIYLDKAQIEAVKWNGKKKWKEEFDADKPHIWSAFTLYPEEQRKARTKMFQTWVTESSNLNQESIFELHQSKNGLLLENSGKVDTVSTTQVMVSSGEKSMKYKEVGTGINVTINQLNN